MLFCKFSIFFFLLIENIVVFCCDNQVLCRELSIFVSILKSKWFDFDFQGQSQTTAIHNNWIHILDIYAQLFFIESIWLNWCVWSVICVSSFILWCEMLLFFFYQCATKLIFIFFSFFADQSAVKNQLFI